MPPGKISRAEKVMKAENKIIGRRFLRENFKIIYAIHRPVANQAVRPNKMRVDAAQTIHLNRGNRLSRIPSTMNDGKSARRYRENEYNPNQYGPCETNKNSSKKPL